MQEHIQNLIDDFAMFSDWEERYAYLIDLGKQLPPMPESQKTENHLVPGCTSRVWMVATPQDGYLHFVADSDAHIVRGLIGVLSKIYNDQPLDLLRQVDIKDVFTKLGLESHLSPNRRNGFFSMVQKLQLASSATASSSSSSSSSFV